MSSPDKRVEASAPAVPAAPAAPASPTPRHPRRRQQARDGGSGRSKQWNVTCSAMAARINNPIRAISDKASAIAPAPQAEGKELIKLSVGDPTLDRNFFQAPQSHMQAVKDAVDSHDFDGYLPVSGIPAARQAVSKFWARNFISRPQSGTEEEREAAYQAKCASIPWEHVVMTSGGSHAIQLAITALCGEGDSILLPVPCFPHYMTICEAFKIHRKYYKLIPNRSWEANLQHIEAQCDSSTKLLVITNPSNPCGSNFTRKHVEAILKLAERLRLPVFSDEIYAGMVFQREAKHQTVPGSPQRHVFTSVADFNTTVPRVILGGTAKQFAVPGWRVGWLIYAGNSNVDKRGGGGSKPGATSKGQKYPNASGGNYLYGIEQQALLIVGPSTIVQGALIPFLGNYSTSLAPRAAKSADELAAETQAEKDEAFFYRCVTQIEKCASTFVREVNRRCRLPGSDPGTNEAAGVIVDSADDDEDAGSDAPEGSHNEKNGNEAEDGNSIDGAAARATKRPYRHFVHAQMPQGAMYVMLKINVKYFDPAVVTDDDSFFEALLREEMVQVVPGSVFRRHGYVRIVITRPEAILIEAATRIAAFCHAHYNPNWAADKAERTRLRNEARRRAEEAATAKAAAAGADISAAAGSDAEEKKEKMAAKPTSLKRERAAKAEKKKERKKDMIEREDVSAALVVEPADIPEAIEDSERRKEDELIADAIAEAEKLQAQDD